MWKPNQCYTSGQWIHRTEEIAGGDRHQRTVGLLGTVFPPMPFWKETAVYYLANIDVGRRKCHCALHPPGRAVDGGGGHCVRAAVGGVSHGGDELGKPRGSVGWS